MEAKRGLHRMLGLFVGLLPLNHILYKLLIGPNSIELPFEDAFKRGLI
jgi:hypothetical protein